MKLNSTQLKKIVMLSLCAAVLFAQPALAEAKPVNKFSLGNTEEEEPVKKKSKTAKNFSSLNNSSVKIYPDFLKREMHVVAKDNVEPIDFFVFDVQGTLVQNYKMKAKDHYRIAGLARGTYIYRVFCGDEETAAGKFEIR